MILCSSCTNLKYFLPNSINPNNVGTSPSFGLCGDSCPSQGFYAQPPVPPETFSRCKVCVSNCGECTNDTDCTSCKTGFYPRSENPSTVECIECSGGNEYIDTTLPEHKCTLCETTDTNCVQCHLDGSIFVCDQCVAGYTPVTGGCASVNCAATEYFNNGC